MEKTQALHDFYQAHPQPASLPAETGQFNVSHLQQVLEARSVGPSKVAARTCGAPSQSGFNGGVVQH